MKASTLKLLNSLLEQEDVVEKRKLSSFIWANTVVPKYKEGNRVVFSEPSHSILGTRCINVVGTVEKINYNFTDKSINYQLLVTFRNSKQVYTTNCFINECDITRKLRANASNINVVPDSTETTESIHISL